MFRVLIRMTCRFGLLLIAGIATAAELAEAPERYEVELIVFRHADQSRNTPEVPAATSIFRPSPLDLTISELPIQPPETLSAPLAPASSALPGDAPSKHTQRPPIDFYLMALKPTYPDFVPLREDKRSLNRVYARLEKIDAYEPILHVGWVQPARKSDNSRPYRFETAEIDTTGIAGTVTLYKERFLHIEIDLTLDTKQPAVEKSSFLTPGAKDTPEVFKLTESRRIRGTTEHYFDHPKFGVIARIQHVKAAATARKENG